MLRITLKRSKYLGRPRGKHFKKAVLVHTTLPGLFGYLDLGVD